MKRWHVEIGYRSENGLVDVHHDIEELSELHNIVELGPNWNAIDYIKILLQRKSERDGFTIEERIGGGKA